MADLANSSTKPKPKLKLYPRNPNRRSQIERDLFRERLENLKDERIRLLCEGGQHTIPESEQTLGIVHEVSLKNPRWIAKIRDFAPSFECPGMSLLGQEISAPEEA